MEWTVGLGASVQAVQAACVAVWVGLRLHPWPDLARDDSLAGWRSACRNIAGTALAVGHDWHLRWPPPICWRLPVAGIADTFKPACRFDCTIHLSNLSFVGCISVDLAGCLCWCAGHGHSSRSSWCGWTYTCETAVDCNIPNATLSLVQQMIPHSFVAWLGALLMCLVPLPTCV